jgi:hypothetical protein
VFEPSTEVIRKGNAGKPNEFGKMVKLQEAKNQMAIDFEVYDKRPDDSDLLVPAIEIHHPIFRRAPHLVAANAAFHPGKNEVGAKNQGCQTRLHSQPLHQKAANADASKGSAGSGTARNGGPDARAASAWPSGDKGSTVVDTKAKME